MCALSKKGAYTKRGVFDSLSYSSDVSAVSKFSCFGWFSLGTLVLLPRRILSRLTVVKKLELRLAFAFSKLLILRSVRTGGATAERNIAFCDKDIQFEYLNTVNPSF